MEVDKRASLTRVEPAKGDDAACRSMHEILQAQHDATLRVLESWLASQEDRLSRLFMNCANVVSKPQAKMYEVECTSEPFSPEDVCLELNDPVCKVKFLQEDVAPTADPASLSRSSTQVPSSDRPSTVTVTGEDQASPDRRRAKSLASAGISERLQDLQEAKEKSYRCNALKATVVHPAFEAFFAFLIIVNAVLTCLEVQDRLESPTSEPPAFFAPIGHLLGVSFLVELVLRIAVSGRSFLYGPGWAWHCFDLFLVLSWCAEVALDMMEALGAASSSAKSSGLSNMRLFRILRITRMFRLLRIARILRFVRALNILLLSILTTLRSLVWASILMLLIIFTFAIFVGQSVADSLSQCGDCAMDADLQQYWGSLPRASLSLFQIITGGKDWDDLARPLMDLSGHLLAIIMVFIVFSQFAVLNVVTGVFCQAAVESAQRDRELMVQSMVTNKRRFVDALSEQFASMLKQFSGGENSEAGLSLEAFEAHMHVKSVREYFALLELDSSDAWMLFKLLDVDGSGIIDVEEFVEGCLRLKGAARSIDLAKLSMEYKHTSQKFNSELFALNGHISDLQKALNTHTALAANTSGGELRSVVRLDESTCFC
eukprot:TRINITY_DN1881_c1_g1_i1.p1 TRINITY_DN1881_c1_g1~~TRINITY_DN1881_c1_g1_i1.p1  ORF type:complete len:601 (+),score=88.67 TRINITY_DN1881_c1_g1_i1:49-1851(+)